MDQHFEYLTAEVDRAALVDLRSWLAGPSAALLDGSGGRLWGAWLGAGSIGWPDDQVVAMVAWPHTDPPAGSLGEAWLAGGPGVASVSSVSSVGLVPTVRPTAADRLQPGGVFAHRWFEVDPDRSEEVVALSAEAWPVFEGAYEAIIHGLFRTTGGAGRLLLVTRYASVAEWERSRGVGRSGSGDLGRARENFERRRALTGRQVVRIAPLAS